MKNHYSFLTIVLLSVLYSCNNGQSEKLLTQLQHENDSLKKILTEGPCKNGIVSDPYPTLTAAYASVNEFQNLGSNEEILIPVAIEFDAEDFMTEMCKGDVKSFRFYPVLDPKDNKRKLHLAMVPVNGDNVDLLGDEHAPRVYNFAKNCPDHCAIQTPYHSGNAYVSFKKQ